MSLTHHGTITPEVFRIFLLGTPMPSIELWVGDVTETPKHASPDKVSHTVATSMDPTQTFIGSPTLNNALGGRAGKFKPSGTVVDFRPSVDGAVLAAPSKFSAVYDNVLFFEPQFSANRFDSGMTPPTPRQSAPYKSDDIFRTLQAYSGHIATAIDIPVTVDLSDVDAAVVMLQSLLLSALKYATWKDCRAARIRIILDQSDSDSELTGAFDKIKDTHDNLFNEAAPAKQMPAHAEGGKNGWGDYVDEAEGWLAKAHPKGEWPGELTKRQVLAIYIYTSEYFHIIQDNLYKAVSASMPKTKDGVGFTDLANPIYADLIPLYAALSSALMNIPAFHGTVYRGANTSKWNSFTPGKSLRFNNYISSADEYFDSQKLPWNYPTQAPWSGKTSQLRIISQSARNISPYSKHGYEHEHLFDCGVTFYIDSHVTIGREEIIVMSEVPKSLLSLMR